MPDGDRQALVKGKHGSVYGDVDYEAHGPVVELDGRVFHQSSKAWDRDLERDLDAAADRETVRLGYAQVYDRGCATAAELGAVMQRRGWSGAPITCPQCA